MSERLPEPWLRGIRLPVSPIVAPVLFALQQVSEDLETHTAGLTPERIWRAVPGIPSLGFHLKHIAGSLDRLTAYLEGAQLSAGQLSALRTETVPGADRDELLAQIEAALSRAGKVITSIDPATYPEARLVGRQKLPTTVIGLIIHIAEHTQRHCGQAITTARLNLG